MEDILEHMLHLTIPKVVGKPSREKIKEVQEKIFENAALVPCKLGGG